MEITLFPSLRLRLLLFPNFSSLNSLSLKRGSIEASTDNGQNVYWTAIGNGLKKDATLTLFSNGKIS